MEAKEEEEQWIKSAIVSASSISSYINVSFPHHCFTTPLALSSGTRGGTSLSLISLYRFSPTPLLKSFYSLFLFFPSFLFTIFLSLLSLSLSPYASSLSHSLSILPPPHFVASHGNASLACPHETSQFSASSADE